MRIVSWILAIIVAGIFVQSLFFKFTDAPESILIFSLIDITAQDYIGQKIFEPTMRYGVGGAEAVAALLVLLPFTRVFGAFIGFVIISGAIFFHLFTELGISPAGVLAQDGTVFPDPTSAEALAAIDGGASLLETGPVLFGMACLVWVACLLLLFIGRGGKSS